MWRKQQHCFVVTSVPNTELGANILKMTFHPQIATHILSYQCQSAIKSGRTAATWPLKLKKDGLILNEIYTYVPPPFLNHCIQPIEFLSLLISFVILQLILSLFCSLSFTFLLFLSLNVYQTVYILAPLYDVLNIWSHQT